MEGALPFLKNGIALANIGLMRIELIEAGEGIPLKLISRPKRRAPSEKVYPPEG